MKFAKFSFLGLLVLVATLSDFKSAKAADATSASDLTKITRDWYENGVEHGNGPLIMGLLADNIEWWCFGPSGFAMNDYYSGKPAPKGVEVFFQRLLKELGPDTPDNFKVEQIEQNGKIVTVHGLEKGNVTPLIKKNAPKLSGKTYYNYFEHRLEFNQQGKIVKFRCNWNLSDHPAQVSPF